MTFSCMKFKKKFRIKFNITRSCTSNSSDLVDSSASDSAEPPCKVLENNSGSSNTSSVANLRGIVKEPSTTSAVSRSSTTTNTSHVDMQHTSALNQICSRAGLSTHPQISDQRVSGSYTINEKKKGRVASSKTATCNKRKKTLLSPFKFRPKQQTKEKKRSEKIICNNPGATTSTLPSPFSQPPPPPNKVTYIHCYQPPVPAQPPPSLCSSSKATSLKPSPPSLPSLASIPSLPSSLFATAAASINTTTITTTTANTSTIFTPTTSSSIVSNQIVSRMNSISTNHTSPKTPFTNNSSTNYSQNLINPSSLSIATNTNSSMTSHLISNNSRLKTEKLKLIKQQQTNEKLLQKTQQSLIQSQQKQNDGVYDKISMSHQVREHFYCPLLLENKLNAKVTAHNHKEAIKQLTSKINNLTIIEQTLNSSQSSSSRSDDAIAKKKLFLNKIIKLRKSEQQSLLEKHANKINDEYNYASSQKSVTENREKKCGNDMVESFSGSSCTSGEIYDKYDENYYIDERRIEDKVCYNCSQNSQQCTCNTEYNKSSKKVITNQGKKTANPDNEYDDVDSSYDEADLNPVKNSVVKCRAQKQREFDDESTYLDFNENIDYEVKSDEVNKNTEYDLICDANERKPEPIIKSRASSVRKSRANSLMKHPNDNVNKEELTMYSENSITYTAF